MISKYRKENKEYKPYAKELNALIKIKFKKLVSNKNKRKMAKETIALSTFKVFLR